jgi:serine/threonine protein kinase
LSPEASVGKPCEKSDIWSCGITLSIMLFGKYLTPVDKSLKYIF